MHGLNRSRDLARRTVEVDASGAGTKLQLSIAPSCSPTYRSRRAAIPGRISVTVLSALLALSVLREGFEPTTTEF